MLEQREGLTTHSIVIRWACSYINRDLVHIQEFSDCHIVSILYTSFFHSLRLINVEI